MRRPRTTATQRPWGAVSVGHDPRAGLAVERVDDRLGLGDEALAFGVGLEEGDDGLDLGAHGARKEVALGIVLLGFAKGQPVEPLLIGLVIVQGHLLHGCGDEEEIHLEVRRQEGRPSVLVDDGHGTPQVALLILDHRDAAAAHANHDKAGIDQRLDGVLLDDLQGNRRGNHASPASPGILFDRPPFLGKGLGLLFSRKTADALGGVLEAGVIPVDEHLSDHCHHRAVDAAMLELVVQRLGDHVADGPLRVGADNVEGSGVHLVGCQFVAAQDKADLRAIAVGYDHIPAPFDHIGNVATGLLYRAHLRGDVLVLLVCDQRVAPDGNHSNLAHSYPPFVCIAREGILARADKDTACIVNAPPL